MVPLKSEMLLLAAKNESYTPEGLEEETGDPSASTRNIAKLLEGDRFVWHATIYPGGVLFVFNTFEMYLAKGFNLQKGRLALIYWASDTGYGSFDEVMKFYDAIPPDWLGTLPRCTAP